MRKTVLLYLIVHLFISCSEIKKLDEIEDISASNLSGRELASMHCTRCHSFVQPELLPKSIWENDVLPAMGHRMGIFKSKLHRDSLFLTYGGSLIKKTNIYPNKPILAKSDWKKIVDFYLTNSLDSILSPKRIKKINLGLKHFKYREPSHPDKYPLTAMVKILPNNKGFVYSDMQNKMNALTFLNSDLEKEYILRLNSTAIHYYENSDTIYLTTIGKNIFPYDGYDGSLQKVFRKESKQNYNSSKTIISKMQRPVFMAYGDLNNDGLEDIVACEYGNLLGNLVWYENMGNQKYTKRNLRANPGAISAVINDMNKDGLNDIVVLMAQGDEGIFLYENKGGGNFSEKRLLTFLPLNGSQYIELVDFNNDGFDDIIYVCGDNADKTPILKKYHGIYIFMNDGKNNFSQSYFYQLNGAYKAIPRDYDLDGDLDIAAISFFPNYYNYPEESFVYLENKGNLEFDNYSFLESTNGRWMVMDAEDMDADGDIDLILGSFVYFVAKGDTTGLGQKWLMDAPPVVVLENTIR